MKRFAALAMVLALLFTPLFGQSALADDVVINWYSDVSGWGPANWTGVTSSPLLDALKENFGVTMSIEQPATDAATKLALMIATNDLPDLISITDSETIAQLI